MAGAVSLQHDAGQDARLNSGPSDDGPAANQPTGQAAPPRPATGQVGGNGLATAPAGAPPPSRRSSRPAT